MLLRLENWNEDFLLINYNNVHYFGYLFIITVVFDTFFPKEPPEWYLAKQEKKAK